MFSKIVLASNNKGKLAEFSDFFNEKKIEIIPQSQFSIPQCEEPYHTFIENALTKARHASKYSHLPALADDSGICFPILNGAPGVFSARFANQNGKDNSSDLANNNKLTSELLNKKNKYGYYVCVLVLIRHEYDPQPIISEGIWHGEWQNEAKGNNGFGYDPHFYLTEYQKTVAEIPISLKNKISHRAIALNKLLLQL